MDKKFIIGIIAVIAIIIGSYFLLKSSSQAPQVQNTTDQTSDTTQQNTQDQNVVENGTTQVPTAKTYDVVYTDAGYSPATLTIKVGDTVNFKNESSGGDWVGSAMHPTHTAYSGTTLQQHCPDTANDAFDECSADKPGESWSFTFAKIGSWGYHNHVNAKHFGKITVE